MSVYHTFFGDSTNGVYILMATISTQQKPLHHIAPKFPYVAHAFHILSIMSPLLK